MGFPCRWVAMGIHVTIYLVSTVMLLVFSFQHKLYKNFYLAMFEWYELEVQNIVSTILGNHQEKIYKGKSPRPAFFATSLQILN
jgi:hypothetical protein